MSRRELAKQPTRSTLFGSSACSSGEAGSSSTSGVGSSSNPGEVFRRAAAKLRAARLLGGANSGKAVRPRMAPEMQRTESFLDGLSAEAGPPSSMATDQEPTVYVKRRAMPAQAGIREDGEVVDDRLEVILERLWSHHRLIPPASLSRNKFHWDMAVIVFVMFNCIFVPVELCFSRADWLVDVTEQGRILSNVDQVVDFFFLMDIMFNFRTIYFDGDGEPVLDWREIARTYALRPPYWFWLDLFGTIPWDLINGAPSTERPHRSSAVPSRCGAQHRVTGHTRRAGPPRTRTRTRTRTRARARAHATLTLSRPSMR